MRELIERRHSSIVSQDTSYTARSETFYTRNTKFGGLEVWEAKRLRQPGDENAKLNELLAETPHPDFIHMTMPSKKGTISQ